MTKILGVQKPYCMRIRKKLGWPPTVGQASIFGQGIFGEAVYGSEVGALGDVSFGIYQQRKCKEGKISIRMKFYAPPETAARLANPRRPIFADAVFAWQGLTSEQKIVYNSRVKGKNYSGYNLYLREYMLSR